MAKTFFRKLARRAGQAFSAAKQGLGIAPRQGQKIVQRTAANLDVWLYGNEWAHGKSSNVGSIRYDYDNKELFVQFRAGSIYKYFDVSPTTARSFYTAPSLGKFVWRHLRGKKAFQRMR